MTDKNNTAIYKIYGWYTSFFTWH